jgi:hypothetical protein
MDKWKSHLTTILLISLLLIQLGAAQNGIGSGSGAEPYGFLDDLFPHSDVDDSGSFFYNVFLPFSGLMAILYFVLLGLFNWASDSLPDAADTIPRRSALVLSAALALMALRFWPLGVLFFPLVLAGLAAIGYALWKLIEWLRNRNNNNNNNTGNGPVVDQVSFAPPSATEGDAAGSVDMNVVVKSPSGAGIDSFEVKFDGNTMPVQNVSGNTVSKKPTLANFYGGGTTLNAGNYSWKVEVEDNNGKTDIKTGNYEVSTPGGGGGGDKPEIKNLNASDAASGAGLRDVNLTARCEDNSGSGLKELDIEFSDLGLVETVNLNGNPDYNLSERLDAIFGINQNLSDDKYQLVLRLEDNNGNETQKPTQFTVGNSNGGGGGGGNQQQQQQMQQLMALFGAGAAGGAAGAGGIDIDVNSNQMQQMQNQMMQMQMMWQQTMQQQQMQQMMTPAAMQFGNFINNNFQVQNGMVVIPGPGGTQSEVDVDIMQQLVQVLSQTQVNQEIFMEMMQHLIIEGGDTEINQELIQNIINIDEGDMTIEEEINVEINQAIQQIEQTFINVVENEYNLTQVQQNFAIQINSFFQAIGEGDFEVNGDVVIIDIEDGGDIEIEYPVFLQLIQLINQLTINQAVIQLLIQKIIEEIIIIEVDGGDIEIDVEVIQQIIQIMNIIVEGDVEEGGGGTDGSDQADITIENFELINGDSGNPLPQKRRDGGSFFVAPSNVSTSQVYVHVQVGSNKPRGIKQIVISMGGFKDGSSFKEVLSPNNSSYGHENDEMIPLSQIAGKFMLKEGQSYTITTQVIGKNMPQSKWPNRLLRMEVGDSENGDGTDDSTPELEPGPERKRLEPPEETTEDEKEALRALIKSTDREVSDLNELLEDLKKGHKWYNKLEEDLEEIDKLHQMMSDGATVKDLSDRQRRILREDIEELNNGLDGLLSLEDKVREEIQRVKEEESEKRNYTVEIEKDDKKIEKSVKEIEEYIGMLEEVIEARDNSQDL